MSGNDAPVRDYVMNSETARIFLDKLTDMVQFLIPNYVERKNQLIIKSGGTEQNTGLLRLPTHCTMPWNRKKDTG